MGQITIFEKENCIYCARLLVVLERLRKEVLQDLVQTSPEVTPELRIKRIDCGDDGALAALCIRLTGTFTVPHVFFNEEYVGDATQFCCLDANSKEGCNILYSKLKTLALKPAPESFPPKPDAAMIKVTEGLAFSSQPTRAQLEGLKAFGLNSVLNLVRADSGAFQKEEEEIVRGIGIEYRHAPMQMVSVESLKKALNALHGLPTPVLVHCDAGQVAGLVVLLRVAQLMGKRVEKATVVGWGSDLGLDLTAFSASIEKVLDAMAQSFGTNGES